MTLRNRGNPVGFAKAAIADSDKRLVLGAGSTLDALKKEQGKLAEASIGMKNNAPGSFEAAATSRAKISALEDSLERVADAYGDPKLVDRLRTAKVDIAKAYAVKNATSDYGLTDLRDLYVQKKSGAALTGRLDQMARFYEAFSPSADEAVRVGPTATPGNTTNYAVRNTALGNPTGPISAMVAPAQGAVRDFMLSDYMQNRYAKPQYNPKPENALSSGARQAILSGGRGRSDRNRGPHE